jgi:phosphatidylserine/phosphatidylglycerophosphate/cardiolipin synthase-like enzyme
MIEVIPGSEVLQMLRRVASNPRRFSELTLCAPFIDEPVARKLEPTILRAARAGCVVNVITRKLSATLLHRIRMNAGRRVRLVIRDDVHAKAYVAHSRDAPSSEAIVTSANLTLGGLDSNEELGVRIKATTEHGRKAFEQVARRLKKLTVSRI